MNNRRHSSSIALHEAMVFTIVMFIPALSYAQSAAASGAAADVDAWSATIITKMVEMVTNLENTVASIGTNKVFQSLGRYMIAVIGATVIIWNILKNMVLKSDVTQIVADLVFPLVVIGLALMALDNNFAQMVNQSVRGLANALAPGQPATARGFTLAMLEVMHKAWATTPSYSIANLLGPILTQILLQLIAMLILMVALAAGVVMILVAQFQVSFALVMAPVMIPWLLFKPTEFLFSGWLTYLLKGSFAFVSVALVSSLGMQFIDGLNANIAASGRPPEGLEGIVTYAALASGCLIVALLMLKADSVGGGVISGSTAGISGFGRVMAGSAAPVIKGAQKIAGGAASAASSIAKGFAHKGKSDAQLSGLQKSLQPRQGTGSRRLYEMVRGVGPSKGSGGPQGGGGAGGSNVP